jgi:glycosyltransferase involved in cell wall biosynthesis
MSQLPRFSVVVPTRDRPELLDFCLQSLAEQTCGNLEVVVADNPVSAPAREVFERWARDGWQYVRPDRQLAMHDNFELGCTEASGELVAVVVDKTVLHPSALEFAHRAIEGRPEVDIVTWWNEGYFPLDEERHPGRGRFVPAANPVDATLYDPKAELTRRFEHAERRGRDPVHYVRGKIVFGAYSRRLLDRIRSHSGRLFHPLAPDYTSMVPGCVLAETAIDLGRPLLVSYNSVRSNGRRQAIDSRHARRFIEAVDPAILEQLPIRGLYSSQHNVVTYDLVSSAARCPPSSTPPLNMPNFLRRVREDLEAVAWADPNERASQYALLEAAERDHGIDPPPRPRPSRVAGLKRAFGSVRRPRRPYGSPVEAARTADRHYSTAAS